MLDCLHIENIAVIEQADIRFHEGFNVLTGETGAGKSIIIDAINAVLGERITRSMVRTGADTAHVTALFTDISSVTAEKLCELGFAPDEDGNLLIGRTMTAEGKGSCSVNGRPATATLLKEMGKWLVDLHGQHENQSLLSVDSHLTYLDRFADLTAEWEQYISLYREWRTTQKELAAVDMNEAEKARKLDMLQFQIQEIHEAAVQVGEYQELLSRRELFRHAEKVTDGVNEARVLLSGGDETEGALSLTQQATAALERVSRYMEQAGPLTQQLQEALYTMQDTADELRSLSQMLDFDPNELDKTETRLAQLNRLMAKYGSDEQAVLEYLERCETEFRQITFSDERIAQLTEQEQQLRTRMEEAAARLSLKRKQAAEQFITAVGEELRFLDMPNVVLTVDFQATPPTATGMDKVEFLLSANVGEPPRPLAKIASGGELSRIMLAMKSVLANVDEIDTLIFDEIDTGISGRAAVKVGKKLWETAARSGKGHRQVLCVTHLAQIAARADCHFLIEKSVQNGRTRTHVRALEKEARIEELARIIGGEVTAATRQTAEEMLTS